MDPKHPWDKLNDDQRQKFVSELIEASHSNGLPVVDTYCNGSPVTTVYAKGESFVKIRGVDGELYPVDIRDVYDHYLEMTARYKESGTKNERI